MASLTDVDMSDAEDLRDGYEPLPPGEYQLFMESSERVNTKSGDGEYLKCVFSVSSGPYENRKVFCNFNLWNKNADAVRIAKAQWGAICFASYGQPPETIRDSAMLHNRMFYAEVKNVPHFKDSQKRSNEIEFSKGKIRGLKDGPAAQAQPQSVAPQAAPVGGQQVQSAPVGAAPAPQPVKPGAGKPPWAK